MPSHMDEEVTARLQRRYCPPIDTALFYALAADFNLQDKASISELSSVLESLTLGTEADDTSLFDPSGSSNGRDDGSLGESLDPTQLWTTETRSGTEVTSNGSLARSVAAPDLNDGRLEYDLGLEELSPDDKVALLAEMFPTLKAFDISFLLKKNDANFRKSVDVLLNQTFVQTHEGSDGETPSLPQGIDGFFGQGVRKQKRQKKGKKHVQINLSESSSSSSSSRQPPPPNKWTAGTNDVDFLAQHTHITRSTIASLYHASRMSLSSTISALCVSKQISNPYISGDDPLIDVNAMDLAQEFPLLTPQEHAGLIYLTYPSMSSAHELAKSLGARPIALSTDIPIIIPKYAPLDLSKSSSRPSSSSSSSNTLKNPTTISYSAATDLAANYNAVRQKAFSQASAAYRRSKSHPHFGGAAAYYSDVGREATNQQVTYLASAADALVQSQSSRTLLDLHGVNVKDAARIACEKVQQWWNGGAMEWARTGKVQGSGGFQIVTGQGKHSQGGRLKIGPAVRKALLGNGWRVEEEQGILMVTGKARK